LPSARFVLKIPYKRFKGPWKRGAKVQEDVKMKIKYCKKYEKYVSQQHCEFFNEGKDCEFYSPGYWNSIKELLQDVNRPKWEVTEVIKPYKCSLLDREYLNQMSRRRREQRRRPAPRP